MAKAKKIFVLQVLGNKKAFVHPFGENKTQLEYVIKKGMQGVSVFKEKEAKEFCKEYPGGLVPVSVEIKDTKIYILDFK